MATKSTIQLRGSFEGEPVGSRSISPTDLVNLTSPSSVLNIQLADGDNTISVPSNASGCIVIFDPNSTVHKTISGNAADVGIDVGTNGWFVLTFRLAAQASFLLSCDGADNNGGGTPIPYTTEIVFF